MAAEHLYIDEEEYFGVLKTKPKVPDDQVWVFSKANDLLPLVCVWGTEGSGPPSAPWFVRFAMHIHKFYQSATFRWTFPLYEHFPLWLNVEVTTTLVDPVSYLLVAREAEKLPNQPTKNALETNQLVKDTLRRALRNILAFERQRDPLSPRKQQQSLEQVVPLTISTFKSKNLSRLLPNGDLGLYLQNSTVMRKLGVRTQVIVYETEVPPVYDEIVKNVQFSFEKELLEARDLILAFRGEIAVSKGSMLSREELLTLGQRLYTNLGDYYESKRSKIEPSLIRQIEQVLQPVQGNADAGLLAAIFFKDIAGMEIEKPLQTISIATTRELVAIQAPVMPKSSEKPEDIRNKHISGLYDAVSDVNSETKDWQFSPKDRNKVKEIILIDVGNNSTIELQVPQGYPQELPLIRAKRDEEPLSQKVVNELLHSVKARPDGYDLVSIVKAVALYLNPRVSISVVVSEEAKPQEQLPASSDAVEQQQHPVPEDGIGIQGQIAAPEDSIGQQQQTIAPEDTLRQGEQLPIPKTMGPIENMINTRNIEQNTKKNIIRGKNEQRKDGDTQKAEYIDHDA